MILCSIFGHARPKQGWWGDGLYGDVIECGGDSVGRTHFQVRLECPRCGKRYTAARFHGHQVNGWAA